MVFILRPSSVAFTAALVLPVKELGIAATVVPYDASKPYSNDTDEENPFGFTNPFKVAPTPDIDVAGIVLTKGAP